MDEFDEIIEDLLYDDEDWVFEMHTLGLRLVGNDTVQDRIRLNWAWN